MSKINQYVDNLNDPDYKKRYLLSKGRLSFRISDMTDNSFINIPKLSYFDLNGCWQSNVSIEDIFIYTNQSLIESLENDRRKIRTKIYIAFGHILPSDLVWLIVSWCDWDWLLV